MMGISLINNLDPGTIGVSSEDAKALPKADKTKTVDLILGDFSGGFCTSISMQEHTRARLRKQRK